jgi:hypothetical protein
VNRHRWCWRGCCLSRQLLAGSGRCVLRGDILRAIVIRRILVIQGFKLQLQLSFTLTSSFNLSALSRKSAFLLFLVLLGSCSALLLFCLLQFALLHLFFECPKSSLCSLALLCQVIFLMTLFFPSTAVNITSIERQVIRTPCALSPLPVLPVALAVLSRPCHFPLSLIPPQLAERRAAPRRPCSCVKQVEAVRAFCRCSW